MAFLYDGKKAVSLAQLDQFMDWLVDGGQDTTEKSIFQKVPWVFRAVRYRVDAIASMPFEIRSLRGDSVVDSSEDYQNAVGFLPDPFRLLALLEASNTLLGRWYLFRVMAGMTLAELRYLSPVTIKPVLDESKGLVGWERDLNGRKVEYAVDKIAYFWDVDPYVELGPPATSPATAALAAAGVLINVDEFASQFAERGMVKATVLGVPQGTAPGEKTRLEEWFNRTLAGIKNAFAVKAVNADAVNVTVIGEGLAELSNLTLTDEKRKDISVALGVPASMIWSGDAGGLGGSGVVTQDDLHFYSKCVVPEWNGIARSLNRQVFTPLGYKLVGRPETLDVFQADETQRSAAFVNYCQKLPAYLVAEILGVELPEGVDYSDLEQIELERQERAMEIARARGSAFDNDRERQREDERRWRTVALRRLAAGRRPENYDFDSAVIPPGRAAQIRAGLVAATTDEEVKAAFAAPFCGSYP